MKKEHFILLHGTLYITFQGFLAAGWKEQAIKMANVRNGANWMMAQNPYTGKRMTQYDSLTDAHKEKIAKWLRKANKCKHEEGEKCECGNPYEYMAKEPIRKMIVKDYKAEAFYMGYTYAGPRGEKTHLPDQYPNNVQAMYTNEASILNMLLHAQKNAKEVVKKGLGLQMNSFLKHACEVIANEQSMGNITKQFPASTRILTKMKEYEKDGYVSLIHSSYGNGNAAKVKDELSESKLLEFIEHPNQYDDVLVAYVYNKWATENGYKPITSGAVGVWRKKKDYEIRTGRYGTAAFNEKYTKQVKGLAPSRVGMLWESDDYNLNYYGINPDSTTSNKDMHRYVSYVVADSKHGLVLGKSYRIAQSPVFEMVQLAYIDAMYYVRSLTGGWYLPFEVKADHWNKKAAFPFFEKIANFVPPAKGNKHRGYIEPLFGSTHLKRAEKLAAHELLNYNGNNLTAKNQGVNMEVLKANDKRRPVVGQQMDLQVETFFLFLQKMPAMTRNNMEAESKEAKWLADWNTLTEEQKRPISDEHFLHLFGFKHEPQGRPITITNRGVEPQIGGIKYSYDLPDSAEMMQLIGCKVHVYYDPYDMSRVLVTDGEGIRFMAKSAELQPRALEDATTGSRIALNKVLAEKVNQVTTVNEKSAKRKLVLADDDFDPEAAMLGQFMRKELKNSIEDASERMMLGNDAPIATNTYVEVEEEDEEDFTQLRLARK